jgi:predicted transcriptional regulator
MGERAHRGTARLHKALGSPRRLRLLEIVRADGPLDVRTLAQRVGLHPSTVRSHLDLLVEVGLGRALDRHEFGAGAPTRGVHRGCRAR